VRTDNVTVHTLHTPHTADIPPLPPDASDNDIALLNYAEMVHSGEWETDWKVAPEIVARADRLGIAIDPESEIATANAIIRHYHNEREGEKAL
jgi:hypothetical protein